MTPSPAKKHQRLAKVLVVNIDTAIKNNTHCGDCEVVYELDWIVDDSTVLRPDIAILCDGREESITKPPALVIEISPPSTAIKDRHVKFEIYQEQKAPYFILADAERETFSIFVLNNGVYEERNNLTSFPIHDNCTLEFNIAQALQEVKV